MEAMLINGWDNGDREAEVRRKFEEVEWMMSDDFLEAPFPFLSILRLLY